MTVPFLNETNTLLELEIHDLTTRKSANLASVRKCQIINAKTTALLSLKVALKTNGSQENLSSLQEPTAFDKIKEQQIAASFAQAKEATIKHIDSGDIKGRIKGFFKLTWCRNPSSYNTVVKLEKKYMQMKAPPSSAMNATASSKSCWKCLNPFSLLKGLLPTKKAPKPRPPFNPGSDGSF